MMMENYDNIFPPNVKILNEFTDAIFQEERNKSIYFFDLYNKYSHNYENNFLEIELKKIGSFISIDVAYKIFENNNFFCIKCKENRFCSGNCNLGFGASDNFFCSPILSIPINVIKNDKYNNPMNIILDIYFNEQKRICDDERCKNGIIVHNITTFYNNFEFPNILIFLIDSLDIIELKKNYTRIKQLFNNLIILDSFQYYICAYYLMPCENHFIILFKSECTDDFIEANKWYLFDNLQEVLFEIVGNVDKILAEFSIHAIIYKKL